MSPGIGRLIKALAEYVYAVENEPLPEDDTPVIEVAERIRAMAERRRREHRSNDFYEED